MAVRNAIVAIALQKSLDDAKVFGILLDALHKDQVDNVSLGVSEVAFLVEDAVRFSKIEKCYGRVLSRLCCRSEFWLRMFISEDFEESRDPLLCD